MSMFMNTSREERFIVLKLKGEHFPGLLIRRTQLLEHEYKLLANICYLQTYANSRVIL